MSIIVKDMELPWACIACPFKIYFDIEDRSRCVAVADRKPVELPTTNGRSAFCPLIEVPEAIKRAMIGVNENDR